MKSPLMIASLLLPIESFNIGQEQARDRFLEPSTVIGS